MKKRVVSLSVVFLFAFWGVFSVAACALSYPELALRNAEKLMETAKEVISDTWNWTTDEISEFIHGSKEVVNNPAPSGNSVFEIYDDFDHHAYITVDRQVIYDYLDSHYPNFDYSQYYMLFYGSHRTRSIDNIATYNRSNRKNLPVYFLPKNTTAYSYYDDTKCYIKSNSSVTNYVLSLWVHTRTDLTAYFTADSAPYADSWKWNSSPLIETVVVNDLQPLESPLVFSSLITTDRVNNHDRLYITLYSNIPVEHDLFGFAGIIYDDGTSRYDGTDRGFINADYVETKSLQGGTEWTWSFDLHDFCNWAKRKRILDLGNFYGFVSVQNDVLGSHFTNITYYNDLLLDLNDPNDGIFEDVEDMPDYDDYKPSPSPFPTFPSPTFNYSPNNNYTTYNYDTVNNYDSTTQNFNEWLGDTITTINNNLSGGLDSIDHNLNVLGDNINNFTSETKNFIEDGYSAVNDYLGDLIIKFNDDFNDWTDSFSHYLGDLFKSLNDNLSVIADNIINAIKLQVVPDKDVCLEICRSNFPLYNDFASLFSDHDVSGSELIIAIPYLSNENASGVELVTRNVDSASFDNIEDVSRDLNSDLNSVPLDGYYVFNVTSVLTDPDYDFGRFRTVAALIISASTVFALFNITLKCFGLNYGALSSDDNN